MPVLPTWTTDRLRLRPLAEVDTAALFAVYGDPEVMQYIGEAPFPAPATVSDMLASVERLLHSGDALEWGVEDIATATLVGTAGLHSLSPTARCAEVGCMLVRRAWGRGLMREALPVLIDHACDALRLDALHADIAPANTRSLRLFAALGFRPLGGTVYERRLRMPLD